MNLEMENNRILVVDDDQDLQWIVKTYLEKHGFQIQIAQDGAVMREILQREAIDLVVLDVTLPGEDGFTLARYLREHHDIGILMLTAADEVMDRIVGLEIGADDYMTKPFEPRELMARIRSVIRRLSPSRSSKTSDDSHVPFGHCVLNLESRTLTDAANKPIRITSMEFDLLKTFAENPNKVLNRDSLLSLAHNRDWDPYDRSIDTRITRLRRKIELDPAKPQIIKTVHGSGYIFMSEETL